MLALYRSGRQAEAVRAYQHTRTVLVEELGLEPSPSLRALHQQILEQSGDLALDEPGGERFAFLATDLEDSTALWDTEPDLMQEALTRHDELLEQAVVAHAGRVFKGTGDGIFAVFADFHDAVMAAVEAQSALFVEDWPTTRPLLVRMGVDEGAAVQRGDDYFGPALNRVSRLMSSGHGGQVLIPASLVDSTPVLARELGQADYKGLGRIEVAQLEIVGLPSEFPELRTDRTPAHIEREAFGHSIRGYELRERLGEGAHGHVYRAYQASVGREVAVKVIRPEFANRTDFVKRFEAEAQFIAQLEHPHIVSLYDYWRDQDGAYLAMQLLRGGSLASSLERAPWRPPAALHLLDQVGVALDYAHRHGVVHRDLKPANVLLDEEGNAYLTDFGIATEHIEAVGLPLESSAAYVSPEELAGAAVGPAADVYGLALLTYEILTGERPELGGQPASISESRHDLPAALDEVLARATDSDPNRRYDRIEDYLRALRQVFGADLVGTRGGLKTVDIRNPFKGLRAFGETDARDFFGRDALIDDLVKHVASNRLTAVVGPSGSGKSSLVRAGLLPAVRRGGLGIDGDVLITEMFPGSFPFEELEAALLRIAVKGQDGLLSELTSDDRGLLRMSKQILPDDASELLIVIDQFEELFSLTTDERTRRQFLACLVTAVGDGRGRIRVVVTMRADYFDRPLADPDFGALLGPALVPIAMPNSDELSVAIAAPARAAGLDLEDGLVSRIVGDVVGQPGALPLLQYSLTELVGQRHDGLLTVAGYEQTGGVSGALTVRAEEIYQGLAGPTQDVAREVFLRLVAVDEDSDDTRRRVRRSELDSLGLSEGALDSVLTEYGSFRLLSFDRDPVTRGPTIEVAHEALIREWPRYREWIDERREDLLLERRLEVASTEWESNDRDSSYLFTGGRLEQYELWSESVDTRLTDNERAFLDDGRGAEDEARATRRSRRRRVLGVVSALAVVAVLLAAVAVVQRNEANDKTALAQQESDSAQESAARAQQSAVEAVEQEQKALDAAVLAAEETTRADDAAAESDALRADAEQSERVATADRLALQAIAESEVDADLSLLLAVAASEQLDAVNAELPNVMAALYETMRKQYLDARLDIRASRPLRVRSRAATSIGPNSKQIVAMTPVVGDEGAINVDVRDLGTGEVVLRLSGVEQPTSVYWDAGSDEILVGHENGKLSFWDPATGAMIRSRQVASESVEINDVSDSHIAYRVGADSDVEGTVIVENRETGDQVIQEEAAGEARLSPSGNYAVLDSRDGIRVHALPSGDERFTIAEAYSGNTGWVAGRDVLWFNEDNQLKQVDLADGSEVPLDYSGLTATVFAASPDGRWLASNRQGGGLVIFGIEDESVSQAFELQAQTGPLWALDWTPDSSGLVSVDSTGEAVAWGLTEELATPRAVWPLTNYAGRFAFIDDDLLAVAGRAGSAEVRNLESGESIYEFVGEQISWFYGSLSRQLRFAGTTGIGVGIRAHDLAAGEDIFNDPEFDYVVRLSGNGRFLVAGRSGIGITTAFGSRRFALIDVDTSEYVIDETTTVQAASFSPLDDMVVIATGPFVVDGEEFEFPAEVVVYDTATGDEIARLSDVDYVGWVSAMSSDGKLFAIGGQQGEVVVYDFEAFLEDPETSEVGRTTMGGRPLVSGLAFSDDNSTLLVAALGISVITALLVGEEMTELWSWDTELPITEIVVRDGHVWFPASEWGSTPEDPDLGLVGIPLDRRELTDFVRSRASRDFTEAECKTYFRSSCADAQI